MYSVVMPESCEGVVLTPSLRPPDPLSLNTRSAVWFQRVLHALTTTEGGGRNEMPAGIVLHTSEGGEMQLTEQCSGASQTPVSLQSKGVLYHDATHQLHHSSLSTQAGQNREETSTTPRYNHTPRTAGVGPTTELMEADPTESEIVPHPVPLLTEQLGACSSHKCRLLSPGESPSSQGESQQVNLKQARLSQTDTGTLKYSAKGDHKGANKAGGKFFPIFASKKERKIASTVQDPSHKDSRPVSASLLPLHDVRTMTDQALEVLGRELAGVQEIAATLVFSGGSSQLREVKRAATPCKGSEVEGVCLAYPTTTHSCGPPQLHYAFLPLDSSHAELDSWCRSTLIAVLGNVRVITFGAQELMSTLMLHYSLLNCSASWLQWTLLDTQLAGWLLSPDCPPEAFVQLIRKLDMQQPAPAREAVEKESWRELVCRDLAMLGPLMVKLYQQLRANKLWSLFADVEVKLIPILAAMETQGIQVNTAELLQYAQLLKAKIAKVEASAHKAAGHSFLINSTNQLRQVLFDELHLDEKCSKKLSKTHVQKLKSTSEAVLTQLQEFHPLPTLVLQYRQLCKVNATYVNGILPYISNGVLKPSWLHTGTATGRLASCNPNIQAFPKQPIHLGVVADQHIIGKEAEEVKIDIREAVKSRSGFTFLAADFRSIELRLLAHLCEDPMLMSFLANQQHSQYDVFIQLASEWLALRVEDVAQAEREKAKRVVYAVVYGVGKERLGEILGVDASHAKELMTSFLAKFPNVQNFMQRTIANCRKNGYLSTIGGRRRWFPQITTAAAPLRSHIERQAVNFPVQGSAADICKCGMIRVMQRLADESPNTRLLLQIHDELLFEVADNELATVSDTVKSVLEDGATYPYSLKVALEVCVTTGKTWASLC